MVCYIFRVASRLQEWGERSLQHDCKNGASGVCNTIARMGRAEFATRLQERGKSCADSQKSKCPLRKSENPK
jgi:hypothetical protein